MIEKKPEISTDGGTVFIASASWVHPRGGRDKSVPTTPEIYGRKEGYAMVELNGENYLDGIEASHLLGVKLSTLYTYVSRGVLRSYKQGIKRQRLYKQAELEALLRLRPSNTSSSTPSDGPDQPPTELPQAEDWVPNV